MSHSILNFQKIRKIKPLGQRQAASTTGQAQNSRGRRLAALRLIFKIEHHFSIQTKNPLGRPGRLRSLVKQTKKPGLIVGVRLLRLLALD
jgi:hypothetical protein